MIKFKQKEFFLNGVLAATSVLGIKQGIDAEKQNEELADQQRRSDAKTRAALDRLANSGASGETKSQAASLFSDRRMFAVPGGVVKNTIGLAKDLWTHSGGGVKKAAKLGAGFAAAGYIGNRVATSLKDHDEGHDEKTGNFLAKAAGTAAVVGGSIMAAKRGWLGPGVKKFMREGYGKRALDASKSVLKENVSPIKRKENGKLGFNGSGTLGLGFGMAPVASYLVQRGSKNDQVNSTNGEEQQSQYSIASVAKGAWGWTRGAAKHLYNNPKQALSGGFNKFANFLGMMGGKGGTAAVQKGADELMDIGKKSGNVYTQKLAQWAKDKDNLNKANLAAGAATIAVGTTAMGLGEKMVKAPTKLIDRDAYKMEEQENGQV